MNAEGDQNLIVKRLEEIANNRFIFSEWINKITPLSETDFPDDMPVSDFFRIDSPTSRWNDLINCLANMGLEDGSHLNSVTNSLAYLQEPTAGRYCYHLVDHCLTLGELRTLSAHHIVQLNGFDSVLDNDKVGIIQKLFNLKP
jgi:hypothetical protein